MQRPPFEVKYLPDLSLPDDYYTLEDIRGKLPKGHWSHNRVLEEVDVALEMGVTPTEFWMKSRSDQTYILARFRVKRAMEAFETEVEKKRLK